MSADNDELLVSQVQGHAKEQHDMELDREHILEMAREV